MDEPEAQRHDVSDDQHLFAGQEWSDGQELSDDLVGGAAAEADDRRPPNIAAGCATGCLAAFLAGGVLLCLGIAAVILLFSGTVDDLPGAGWRTVYVVVSLFWGVAAGCVGFLGAYGSRRVPTRRPGTFVGVGLAGLVLAVLWPLQVLALAGYLGERSPKGLRTRIIGSIAAAVAVGGTLWGALSYRDQLLHRPARLAVSDVVGTWRSKTGAQIDFQSDGTVSVMGETGFFARTVNASSGTETGTWRVVTGDVTLAAEGSEPDSPDADGRWLTFYDVASTRVLCAYSDPDAPCDEVFYRR